MESFWQALPKPFFAMAPMADVTDPAWRGLVAELGRPNVMFTEFVSADGLSHTRTPRADGTCIYGSDSDNPLMRDLQFTEAERPIVAQFFTGKPEMMAYAARLKEAVREVQNLSYRTDFVFPVSVKTRIGYSTKVLDEWLPALLAAKPAAITLHLRTRKEMSLVPAQWEVMKRAVAMRDTLAPEVLLLGNGDIMDLDDARAKVAESGCDGAMIGRGMFGNPWVFTGRKADEVPLEEKLAALLELAQRFERLSPPKHFAILKKHIKAFVTGFDGAAELRAKLMAADNARELAAAVRTNEDKTWALVLCHK